MATQIVAVADCIFYVRELVTTELCADLIGRFEVDPGRRPGLIVDERGGRGSQQHTKVSTDLEIPQGGSWAAAHAQLHQAVSLAVMSLAAQLPALQVLPLWWTGYKIQRYTRNEGYFRWHFDALGPGGWERQLALILYLNSVAEGGETSFHRQNVQVKPVAGDAVLFPTFWTHMHCGEVPRSGDKYIISSFVSFKAPGAA
jgi:prolyl 4-hydroxylase